MACERRMQTNNRAQSTWSVYERWRSGELRAKRRRKMAFQYQSTPYWSCKAGEKRKTSGELQKVCLKTSELCLHSNKVARVCYSFSLSLLSRHEQNRSNFSLVKPAFQYFVFSFCTDRFYLRDFYSRVRLFPVLKFTTGRRHASDTRSSVNLEFSQAKYSPDLKTNR